MMRGAACGLGLVDRRRRATKQDCQPTGFLDPSPVTQLVWVVWLWLAWRRATRSLFGVLPAAPAIAAAAEGVKPVYLG